MARRKSSGMDAVAALPWPAGIALGLLGYCAVRYGVGWYFSGAGGAVTSELGRQLSAGALAPLAWMLLIVCWVAAGASYVRSRQRKRLLQTRTDLGSIAALDWRAFEQLVGEAFRREGYQVEETGQGGADGGVDLVLRKAGRLCLVQCKRWRQQQVPVTTVREMWGLLAHYGADAVKIVCVGEYTPDARRFAAGKTIELVTGDSLTGMVRRVQTSKAPAPGAPGRAEPVLVHTDSAPAGLPVCPKCDRPMVRRTNRRDGTAFWGCAGYPVCRGTRTI